MIKIQELAPRDMPCLPKEYIKIC